MKTVVPTPPRAAVIYLGMMRMQSPQVEGEIELPELVDTPPPAISDTPPPAISDTPPTPVQDGDNKNLVRDEFNDGSADA